MKAWLRNQSVNEFLWRWFGVSCLIAIVGALWMGIDAFLCRNPPIWPDLLAPVVTAVWTWNERRGRRAENVPG